MRNLIFKCLNLLKLVIVLSVFAFISYGCGGGGGGDEGVAPATGGGPTQIPTWYKDADGDGYSDGTTQKSETRPSNIYHKASELTATSGDCNDNDSSIHPGASEVCNDSKDNDCDGKTDEDCVGCLTSYYVSPVGNDSNSCLSPGTPCKTIQHTIDVAIGSESNPVTIHVAAGTYKEHLVMDSLESLEGGWNSDFSQRWDFENDGLDPDPTYATIIDGEESGTCLRLENIEAVTVDGFTIQNGKGDIDQQDPYSDVGYGGGAYCHNSSVNFKHTTFFENTAEVGMALYNYSSSVVIFKCLFRSNYYDAEDYRIEGWLIYHVGGTLGIYSSDFIENWGYYANSGILNYSDWSQFMDCGFIGNGGHYAGPALYNMDISPLITNCLFEDNWNGDDPYYGDGGGAITNSNSNPHIINCMFVNNSVGYDDSVKGGGAITNFSSSPEIINCTFINNSAGSVSGGGAGAIENYNSSPTIINCTFVDNYGYSSYGDGYCCDNGTIRNIENSSPTITNNILWYYDHELIDEPFVVNDDSSTVTVTFSNIDQDDYEGQNGNIRQDPMFYDTGWDDNGTPDEPDDDVWVGGDYHLQQGSPCINAGDNSALPSDNTDLDNDGDMAEQIPLDLDGNPRILDGVVDMGAYE